MKDHLLNSAILACIGQLLLYSFFICYYYYYYYCFFLPTSTQHIIYEQQNGIYF